MNIVGTMRCRKRQKGIAIVEFAIGVILLLVITLVTAELGRAFYSYNTLTKSVRSGARYFSVIALNDYDNVDLTSSEGVGNVNETKNVVVTGENGNNGTPILKNFTTADVAVSEVLPFSPGGVNSYITVAATYTFVPIFSSVPSLGQTSSSFDFNFTMQAASTMRVQK